MRVIKKKPPTLTQGVFTAAKHGLMEWVKSDFPLLVRIHFIIVMIRWSGLAPWEFQFSEPSSLNQEQFTAAKHGLME